MDDISSAISAIQNSVKQNNAWSAAQAQNQMLFQERMSNTAHFREVQDLKAAGLNPVLSAKLGGASTPSGAMGTTDTSGTGALIDLLGLSMQAANSAAGAAYAAAAGAEEGKGKLFGVDPLGLKFKNPRNAGQMIWNAAMDIASNVLGDKDWTMADLQALYNGLRNKNSGSGLSFADKANIVSGSHGHISGNFRNQNRGALA